MKWHAREMLLLDLLREEVEQREDLTALVQSAQLRQHPLSAAE
jgi:hypothetical protein